MSIHYLDKDSVEFIMQLRSVSKEIALWASEELLRGTPLDEIKLRMNTMVTELEKQRKTNVCNC